VITTAGLRDDGEVVGDGKTFEQALRALDKLITEHAQVAEPPLCEPDPVPRAQDRFVAGSTTPQH
jgi:hypothetical protein